MAGQILHKVKNRMEEFFPLRSFILSFASLMLLLFCYIGIHQAFFGKDDENIGLTGKVMAEIQIEDIKPEPAIEPPKPVEEKVEPPKVETPEIDPEAPLEESTATPTETHEDKPPQQDPLPNKPEEIIPAIQETAPPETVALEDSIAGLSEKTPLGFLPIVRKSDGLKSFEAYKTPFVAKPTSKAVISLVMVDFGLSDTLSKLMIDSLPPNISLVASPYSTNIQAKISEARAKAFEIWLNLPMENHNFNIGQNAILSGLNSRENMLRLNTHLSKATGYAGIAIDAQSQFPENSPELQNLTKSSIDELVVTDTIPLSAEMKNCSKIRQLSMASLLAEAIRRVNNEESVSAMFN